MKSIHKKIYNLAFPYYKKGRDGDVEHLNWLIEVIPQFLKDTNLDSDIMMPLIILHDTGYSKTAKKNDAFNKDVRIEHTKHSEQISDKILNEINYPKDKIKKINYLVLHHDDWAFGKNFSDEPLLEFFTNFDFMWMASIEGFEIVRKIARMKKNEFVFEIERYEKINQKEGRVWYNKEIQKFYNKLMIERKKELKLQL
ncbi:hypothetical protein HN827_06545 [archaeon]|jgi:hypothetical protein|nr:hypothetical protein [archaeon]MBT7392461.1 hypothetical protein [archaeon]